MENIKEKLDDIESRLIEQEHRPIQVITNFLISRKKYEKGSKKRDAALKAMIWRLFYSPTTVAVGAGSVGLISLFFIYRQTNLIDQQNTLIENQNKVIARQFTIQTIANAEDILYDTTNEYHRRSRALRLINELRPDLHSFDYLDMTKSVLEGQKIANKAFSNSVFGNLDKVAFHKCIFSYSGIVSSSPILNQTTFKSCQFNEFSTNSESYYTGGISTIPFQGWGLTVDSSAFNESEIWLEDAIETTLTNDTISNSSVKIIADNCTVAQLQIINPKELFLTFKKSRVSKKSSDGNKVKNLSIEIATLDSDFLLDFKNAKCENVRVELTNASSSSHMVYIITNQLDEFDLVGDRITVINDNISFLKMLSAMEERYEIGLSSGNTYELIESYYAHRNPFSI